MDTISRSKTKEVQARVDDYLDDQIQTAADLDGVGGLIARVQEQQDLLKQQLQDAQAALAEAQRNAESQADTLRRRAQQFQKQQADIDVRLKDITGSQDSDEAVKTFESRMVKLRRLDVAIGYIELFQEADTLNSQAREVLKAEPRTALTAYLRLRSLARGLQQAQPEAEGAAPHLMDQVGQSTLKLRDELSVGLVKSFQTTLEKIKWPQKELNLLGGTLSTWSEQASLLLELREPDLLVQHEDGPTNKDNAGRTLLPLEVMVQPLAQRFRYHFFGDKPTNRLDKPEYFLSHVLDLVDRHSNFMTDAFQPVLDARVQASEEFEYIYSDAVSEFVTALLPIVTAKCLSVLPQMSSHPQLLSHFIHELMSFDNTLRDSWTYKPAPGILPEWKGLTWEILITHDYFHTWLAVEKEFALSRYRTIRDAQESTDIDFDGVEPNQTKPTKGTVRVNDLLETITDRYRALSSFSQKIKFLIGVQLSIFDDYHQHLYGALQAYLASSHTAGRLLQGQSKSEALGERGLATLCKIYGSAEFLERKMADWGDDLFFLELWEELQDRASVYNSKYGTIGRDLSVEEVAAKTSSTITQDDNAQLESEGGGLFDETASSYRRLKELAEVEILRLLEVNIKDALLSMANVETWASLSNPSSDVAALSPSSALDGMIQATSTLLSFLRKVMAPAPLRKAGRHFCTTLQNELINTVILRHSFSAAGVAQLKRDILALETTIDSATGAQGLASSSMRKLNQATYLLGLPIRTSATPASADRGDQDEDDWGFEDAQEDADTPTPMDEDKVWSLWEAEKAIFRSNEAARHALSEMGLDHLGENEARNILKKRIEVSS